jgi:hypothetical protein
VIGATLLLILFILSIISASSVALKQGAAMGEHYQAIPGKMELD